MELLKQVHTRHSGAMSDTNLLWLLIAISSGGLLLSGLILVKISGKLARIEQSLESLQGIAAEKASPAQIEANPGSAFETFLNEQSERRKLPKNEQFAAYRKWRKEKGMNWSK